SLAAATTTAARAARHHTAASAALASRRAAAAYVLLSVVAAVAATVFVKQYRSLVRPLLWLRDDMQRSAARDYREEVRARGDREFRDLAGHFNGLARDLSALYRDLEAKVIARSRELVRSERLASVGFLAAGVAHEINNPLSVISGYAELAGKGLRRVMLGEAGADADGPGSEAEAEALAAALDAQTIIRDEAFRCKEITTRLLSLARGGTDGRAPLALDDVARQVAVLTKGLRNYRDRRVVVAFEPAEPLEVVANPTEMKQVLLNLTINALEAVPTGGGGEVRIGGRRFDDWVELSVEDNGKGMSRETLEQVFEPFFTAKRGAGEPGTGLGLSITHAIVENHGGRIRAESAGVGRGSRFVVRLPAIGRAAAAVVAAAGVAPVLNLA
ncbi:MAG: fixL 3, partial [Phycisphaerales bacterium]|nr:fixL 3 [Phycisphaerales bacterium]